MNERLIHLRIKVKTLVAEARIIRAESKKTKGMVKWGLKHHNTTVVRSYTRLNLLAYGLLKGVPYEVMEKKCREEPNFSKVEYIAKNFGGKDTDIESWIKNAIAYLDK